MEFLKNVRQKTVFSEVTYYALNLGLAVLLLILTQTIQSPLLALSLVLLSKWRIFAVRPRYWWSNIQANMVDIIVGVSVVALMYLPQAGFVVQTILAFLYAVWLLILKPLSKRWHMMLQAGIAILAGTSALYAVSYEWPLSIVVITMLIIGYSAARHFLYSYEEEQMILLSVIWGIIFAEIGWLAHHWAFSYPIIGLAPLRIPQVTLVLLLLSFLGERLYRSWKTNKQIVVAEIAAPAALVSALIVAIFIFFNSVTI